MPKVKKNSATANATAANVGYEAELWQMADTLRGSMDAAIAANLKELGYGGQEEDHKGLSHVR